MRAVDYFMNDLLYYKFIDHAKIGKMLNETCLVTSLIPTRNGLLTPNVTVNLHIDEHINYNLIRINNNCSFFMLDPNLQTTIDTTLGVTLLSFGYINIDKKLSPL